MVPKKILPRGIRNNNPLNIRIGNTWLGERSNPTDPSFEEFVSMAYGIRAAFIILRRYIRRYHRNTIQMIIETWAPSTENATQKYIDCVCQRTGLRQDVAIAYEDRETMFALIKAMAWVECGVELKDKDIKTAYDMA